MIGTIPLTVQVRINAFCSDQPFEDTAAHNLLNRRPTARGPPQPAARGLPESPRALAWRIELRILASCLSPDPNLRNIVNDQAFRQVLNAPQRRKP